MYEEYKSWIMNELESWAETFNNNYPDHMEEIIEDEEKSYYFIHDLIEKYADDRCTKEDYENILFHIWQSKSDL